MLVRLRLTTVLPSLIAVGLGLLSPATTVGQNQPSANQFELEYAGSALWSGTRRVVVQDSLMFVAQVSGLQVYDISDLSSPTRIWQQYAGSRIQDMAITGEYLYLDKGEKGIMVYLITDPAAPVMLGTVAFEGIGRRILAPGDGYLYRACTDRVQIIDLADPTAPVVVGDYYYPVGEWRVTYVHLSLAVSDNILFLGAFDLFLLDITDPTSPDLMSRTDTPHLVADIEIRDSLAFIAGASNSQPAGRSGLLVYDWSNPEEPELVGRLNKFGDLLDLSICGDYAYLAGGPTGAAAIDISDPTDPQTAWCIAPVALDESAGVQENVSEAFEVVTQDSILIIVNWAPSMLDTAPYIRSMCDSAATFHPEGAFIGDMLFYDIADPANPVQAGILRHPGYVTDFCIDGDLAYVADEIRGIAIVDISHPDTLIEISILPSLARSSAIAARGDVCYVWEMHFGLHAIDVSDPADPFKIGSLQLGGYVEEMAIYRDSLYIAPGSPRGLVIDISEPRNPISRGRRSAADSAFDVLAWGQVLYVADPTITKLLEQLSPATMNGVAFDERFLYSCDYRLGVRVFDTSSPEDTLVQVAGYDTPGAAFKTSVHQGYLYVADHTGLLRLALPIRTGADQ